MGWGGVRCLTCLLSCCEQELYNLHSLYKVVVFAILEDANSVRPGNPGGNCAPFANEFQTAILNLKDMVAQPIVTKAAAKPSDGAKADGDGTS